MEPLPAGKQPITGCLLVRLLPWLASFAPAALSSPFSFLQKSIAYASKMFFCCFSWVAFRLIPQAWPGSLNKHEYIPPVPSPHSPVQVSQGSVRAGNGPTRLRNWGSDVSRRFPVFLTFLGESAYRAPIKRAWLDLPAWSSPGGEKMEAGRKPAKAAPLVATTRARCRKVCRVADGSQGEGVMVMGRLRLFTV